jgi:S1-C subfamily serine protease
MFAEAYKIATHFTFPLIISNRFYDATIESGLGSFVIINDDGWIITAAHVLQGLQTFQVHQSEMTQFQQTKTAGIEPNPKWILNHSMWFGADHHRISQFHVLPENDLAIGKIDNLDPNFVKHYPIFQRPNGVQPATSLCKLGYPFFDLQATFSEASKSFAFDPSIFPIPTFPMDGMMTRQVVTGKSPNGYYDYKWIETSTPGLRGQSGGPTFDKFGKIWAIQSKTMHLPLGFSPKIIKDGKEIEENQFLNVGLGVHVETMLKFLDFYKVEYQVG